MKECPECGSDDTKKAKAVVAQGSETGKFGGVGVGAGGLGIGGGVSSSETKLAKIAEKEDEPFGLMGFFTGVLFLGALVLSIGIGAAVTQKYEIVVGILSGVVSLGIMAVLVHYIAALLALLFTAFVVLLFATYLAEEYSWWVGGPVGGVLAFILLSMAWGNIKNVWADLFSDASAKEYEKTWICLTCNHRWIQD
jgi:hypothetical protein